MRKDVIWAFTATDLLTTDFSITTRDIPAQVQMAHTLWCVELRDQVYGRAADDAVVRIHQGTNADGVRASRYRPTEPIFA